MKQISKSKHRCSAGFFKTTALVATLATAMFASSAQAAVVITEVSRSTFANNNVLPLLEDTSTALSGVYNQTLTRNFFFDEGPANASASQNTSIAAQIFEGSGISSIENPPGEGTKADVKFRMLFTLTESYVLSGILTLVRERAPQFGGITDFSLSGGDLDDFDLSFGCNEVATFTRTLVAGDYRLNLRALSDSTDFGGSETAGSAFSSFNFSVVLTELDDTPPPNNVPEPGSLALMGAGVLAAAASRRKRPLLLAHA
jgi:hypothetical protein